MASEGPGEEPAETASFRELKMAGGSARTSLLNLRKTGSALRTSACFG